MDGNFSRNPYLLDDAPSRGRVLGYQGWFDATDARTTHRRVEMAKASTKTKVKSVTVPVPQTDSEAAKMVGHVGELQHELLRLDTDLNEAIAVVKAERVERIARIKDSIRVTGEGLVIWATANRARLTQDGRSKSIAMLEGTISWRMTPPAVSLRGVSEIVRRLRDAKLTRFLRTKEEPDKQAMLREPEVAGAIDGISISQREEFSIKPSRTNLEMVL